MSETQTLIAASPGVPAPSRVTAAWREFTTGFRQFWHGYWQAPPGC